MDVLCCLFRMRLLLLNTFDLSESDVSIDNVTVWISQLNHTNPEMFAAIASKIEDCSLEAELDTVQSLFIYSITVQVLR